MYPTVTVLPLTTGEASVNVTTEPETAAPDGRVIVVGGQNGATHVGTTVTALFDPFTNTWTQGTPDPYERWYASVTVLPNGKVLATSGDDAQGNRVSTPTVYDPIANTWTKLTGAVRSQSLYPLMYVLPNGKVYEAGPGTGTALLDPSGTGSWTAGPSAPYATNGYSESSAMYAPGKILRAGGGDPGIARAAVIDMSSGTGAWQEISPMSFPRRRLNLTILADGQVMAVGGTRQADSESVAVLEGEIWNPATQQWTTVAAMSEARMYHSSAVLLPDGRVLTAGGEATGRLHAQIYSPPYLFKGTRPAITSAPATASYGSAFLVSSPDAASITSVALIRLSAATHAWDQNQRYVPLDFSPITGGLTVTAPSGATIAPPGYYMLVIKNGNGVPSVAKYVRVDSAANLAPGSITGTVTVAATGAPKAGAAVSTNGASTTTGADGTFSLTDVTPGEHVVTVSAAGFATMTAAIVVAGGQTATLNFALSPPGTITGHVTDAAGGSPVAGAAITYQGGEVTTAADGSYTISGIASGNQTITASATGYDSLTKTAAVPANASVTVDFALTKTQTWIAGGVSDSVTLQPIQGATVSYSGGSTTTDALGRYKLQNTPPGTYDVTASAPGYLSATHQVVVTAGAYASQEFALVPASASARIKDITFEAGSLTAATNGVDKVSGTGVSLVTQGALSGNASARVNGSSAYLEESFAATDDLYLVCSLRLDSVPSKDTRVIQLMNSGTTVGVVQIRPGRTLRLRVGSTNIGLESAPLGIGEEYRVGVHQRRGTGGNAVLEAFLAEGDDPFAAPFSSRTNGTWTTSATRLRLGATSGGPVNVVFDDVLLDAAAMPQPGGGGGGPPPPPPLAPVADFTATPTSGTGSLTTSFTDLSTGNPTAWSWTFGDGTSSTAQNPVHLYSSPGVFDVTLTASNAGGGNAKTRLAYITVLPTGGGGGGTPFTVTPTADAHVKSSSPNSNYGTQTTLQLREGNASNPITYHAYLTFNVSGTGGSVAVAKLRLYVTDSSAAAGRVYAVANGWAESGSGGITWSHSPDIGGSPIATGGQASAGSWVEFDVTSAVQADGQVSFALTTTSTDSVIYSSREGAQKPQLVVTPG